MRDPAVLSTGYYCCSRQQVRELKMLAVIRSLCRGTTALGRRSVFTARDS